VLDACHISSETGVIIKYTMLSRRILSNTVRVVGSRSFASQASSATVPKPPEDKTTKREENLTPEKDKDDKPAHGRPGSKKALASEDFADEAHGGQFAKEPSREKGNSGWPR